MSGIAHTKKPLFVFRILPTCCDIIPLTNALNGSISSANPSAENILHGCFSIIGFNLGSTLIKCSIALFKTSEVDTFTAGGFDGDTSSIDLLARSR